MRGEWIRRPAPGAPSVVFVHGVLSSSETCWQHAKGGYWPTIVAHDPALPGLGVYVFSYSTGFFTKEYDLSDVVDALKEHLGLDGIVSSDGIVFVCHSMGGIVVRRYLVSRAAELIAADVPVALFLVASPSLGSDYATWLAPIARALHHSQADALRFAASNSWLNDLDRDFLNLKEERRLRLVGKELIEDRFVVLRRLIRRQVVPRISGARYFGHPYKVPESNHFSIAKIANGDEIQHRLLRRFIIEWREGIAAPPPIGPAPLSPSGPSPAAPCLATAKSGVSVVLNLNVDFDAGDEASLERLQETLRMITGNPDVTIVEARDGSLLLFVSDPGEALLRIEPGVLRDELLRLENVELVGLSPIPAFEARPELIAELRVASAQLLDWPSSLPGGDTFDRPELALVQARIAQSASSTTAIIGSAGAGKSALLAKLAASRLAEGWPVLAIKADLLDPDIVNEDQLREHLGLARAPSTILRDLSRFAPVLLVIDQLDALAGHLDIKTARLSVLLNLVRRLAGIENVHIVLSSRPFEFQHDVRLSTIGAESVTLELPSWESVLAVLEAHGEAAAGWPPDAKEMMRTPQALAVYLQLSGRRSGTPFTSYQLMLDLLWQERVLQPDRSGALDRLATDIAEAMADEESLWLAKARYPDRTAELASLEAAGVLAPADASVGFSHQTLFEFALARSYARQPGRLSRIARDRQASLFLRPKLWAALTYLREADRGLYHSELEAVWAIELRPHLRALVIDFLGSQPDPTDREAILMDGALGDEVTRLRAFKALAGSPGWFSRLADTRVALAMRGDDALSAAQIRVLTDALPFASTKVAELIRRWWLPDPANDVRSWAVLQWSSPWSPEALSIASDVIGRSEIAAGAIDRQVGTIAVGQPDAAIRLVRAKLDRELKLAIAAARQQAAERSAERRAGGDDRSTRLLDLVRNPLRNLIERGDEWDSLPGIAEAWPLHLLDGLLPWFEVALTELARLAGPDRYVGFPISMEADFRFEDESDRDLQAGPILSALRIAVETLADRDAKGFRVWAARHDEFALTPIQRLIAHGISRNPEALAKDALAFALGDERRLFLGSVYDQHGTIKRMVAAASPFWTSAEIEAFEDRVRRFAPPAPPDKTDPRDRMQWRHMTRHAQVELLRALPGHRRSPAVQREILEGDRRFGTGRRGVTFGATAAIGSIIDAASMASAADDDIVNAFVELPDATGWDNPRRWHAGGNVQLARAFAGFAKVDPDRAVGIIGRLDAHNGVRATAYALDALSEDAGSHVVQSLVRDTVARGFDGDEYRPSVARALERLSRRDGPPDADMLELLERWLADPLPDADGADDGDEAPADDEGSDAKHGGDHTGMPSVEGSLLWGYGGIGRASGGDQPIVEALVEIRLRMGQRAEASAVLSRHLDREKRLGVWEALARYLPAMHDADDPPGASVLRRVMAEVPGAVGSRAFANILAEAQDYDHPLVERQLDAWRDADSTTASQAYGEIVALDALLRPDRRDTQERLDAIVGPEGGKAERFGAVLSAVHVMAEAPELRGAASTLLGRLLAPPEPTAWSAAFEFFRLVEDLVPDDGTLAFLRILADGVDRAEEVDPTFVVDRLATLLPAEATLVGEIALALTAKWKSELADIRTATARATSPLVDMAVTLHRLSPATRDIGLRLFEELIDVDAYEARQALDEIDNRFRENAPVPKRPRVRRRSEVAPRRRRR